MVNSEDSECRALLRTLGVTRGYILECIEGLDDESLRRPVLPSGWSCLGLIRHLTLDDECFWFQAVVAGNREAIDGVLARSAENAWIVPSDVAVDALLDDYRRASERADELIGSSSLDGPPAWWPDFFGSWRLESVREVVLHVIRESATHAGQLDAVRELIDGKQHLVLTA